MCGVILASMLLPNVQPLSLFLSGAQKKMTNCVKFSTKLREKNTVQTMAVMRLMFTKRTLHRNRNLACMGSPI